MTRNFMKKLLWTFLIYVLLCAVLPPLLPQKAGGGMGAASLYADTRNASERVLCIDDNNDALLWRLRVIGAAQEKIVLSVYDFKADESGRDILAALLDASERGVKVECLVDGINGALHLRNSRYFKALASQDNVRVRFYNPPHLWNFWRVNYRMHDKYLIADDSVYILGGRNIHDGFLGSSAAKRSIDRDILVYETKTDAASSLYAVKAYFAGIWGESCCREIRPDGQRSCVAAARGELRERYAALASIYDIDMTEEDWIFSTIETEKIALLTNPTAAWNKEPTLWRSLCETMAGGNTVTIQTPYIIFDRAMYRELSELCDGGVTVRLMTNALSNGANPFGCSDYMGQKTHILNLGAEVFEYAGGDSLHTKTILIDDTTSIVGSFNMDMRSAALDTEMMLVIESPMLAEQIAKTMQDAEAVSMHVYPNGTETAGDDYAAEHLSAGKTVLYAVLMIVLFPFRYLL